MEAINHISGIKPTLKRLLYADQLAKQHTVTKLSKVIRQRFSGKKGAHTKSAHPESITALSQHAFYNFLLFDAATQDKEAPMLYVLSDADHHQSLQHKVQLFAHRYAKDYLEIVYANARQTVLQSLVAQFSKAAREESDQREKAQKDRVDASQWEYHFNALLLKAINLGSSDVHIIAEGDVATVQSRVHGRLVEIEKYTYSDMLRLISSAYNQMASAGSKDQSFSPYLTHETAIIRQLGAERYQLRFISRAIYPHGSFNVVMRLLPLTKTDQVMSLQAIGYAEKQIALIEQALLKPSGLIVTTGKVGCGKSTTNQTLLTQLLAHHDYQLKAYTIEFPVEYLIEGPTQIELKREQGLSQAEATRKVTQTLEDILRMDPDILLLGKVRGEDVATLAGHMVQSGHKVFTTMHTQNALKVFDRFMGLGVDKELLTQNGFISLLIYQSLVCVPCDHCGFNLSDYSAKYPSDLAQRIMAVMDYLALDHQRMDHIKIINAKGCEHCQLGVSKRTVIAEVVEPNHALLKAVKGSELFKINHYLNVV